MIKTRFFARALVVGASVLLSSAACSSESTTPEPTPSDAGSEASTGPVDASTGGLPPTSPMTPVKCTPEEMAANDFRGKDAVVIFADGPNPAQYAPSCLTISAGQTITYKGNFTYHPITGKGGDTPTPMPDRRQGTELKVTFPNAGIFGFECEFHPHVVYGAVAVYP